MTDRSENEKLLAEWGMAERDSKVILAQLCDGLLDILNANNMFVRGDKEDKKKFKHIMETADKKYRGVTHLLAKYIPLNRPKGDENEGHSLQ